MLIETENLEYAYNGTAQDRAALSGITFGLGKGECLGIVGGPGAGKSTLAQNIAGILHPLRGKLVIGGVEASGDRASRRTISGMVGYVPQWPERQLFGRTVSEDISAGLGSRGREDGGGLVDSALADVGLDPAGFRSRPVFALSGAESRKVAIAGVVIQKRDIVIFDEPTAGLDQASRKEILGLLSEMKGEGRTLLIISHRLSDLVPLADKLLVLDDGRCRYFGPVDGAISDQGLLRDGIIEWPPLIDLMARLKRRCPGLKTLVEGPEEACEEIIRAFSPD